MANEIISTFTTAPYYLDTFDVLYIAETGRIISSSIADYALSYRTATDNAANVAIDGQVISLSLDAINLSRSTPTDRGGNEVVIGQGGLVRSVQKDAIDMTGYDNSVFNAGEISAGDKGVYLAGATSEVINAGTIRAEGTGIRILGDYAVVLNSGQITGGSAVSVTSGTAWVTNSGTIQTSVFGNLISVTAALYCGEFDTLNFENTGLVTSATSAGANLSGEAGSDLNFINHGQILGQTSGALINLTATGQADIENGGLISGTTYGLSLGPGYYNISNLAGGQITSTGTAAIQVGSVLRLHNSGTIAATGQNGDGIALGAGSANSSLSNAGIISSTFGAAIDGTAVLTGGSLFLTNLGTIDGDYLGGAVSDYLTNRGMMTAVFSGLGDDVLRNRGVVTDYVSLGSGADSYDGRRGEVGQWVDGGQDNDLLQGGAAGDDLRGGIGDDTLLGGGDDDRLQGGAGIDQMTGGAGNDVFVFDTELEAGNGLTRDRISDFNKGNDTIDLSGFMTGASFIGAAAFSAGSVGEVRYDAAAGRISGDVNGDGITDWQIALTGKPPLTAADFLF